MVFEEMSELTKELTKFFRGKKDIDKIAEEIADVKIMLEQLEIMFGIEDDVTTHQLDKLWKLEEMLKLKNEYKRDD